MPTLRLRLVLPALLLAAVLFALGAALVVGRAAAPGEPVYTVARVTAGMAHRPGAWVGRTVLVRAVAVPIAGSSCPMAYPSCGGMMLADSIAPGGNATLTINDRARPDNGPWTFLRRLPVIGRLISAPSRTVPWGQPATYRLQLYPHPYDLCTLPCMGVRLISIVG